MFGSGSFVFAILVLSTTFCCGAVYRRSDVVAFELSVVHINDFHARFEETNLAGGGCKNGDECIGGFSRMYKKVTSILEDKPKSILLNAGDNFQGTLWYTVGKWNVTQEFMNKLPFDAGVLGNHEFDDGIAGIVPYIKAVNHPIIVSNIDDSLEPDIQGTYTKSVVVERDGKKIGIVGVITSECAQISNTGKLSFYEESSSVNAEAERLVEEKGVFTVIVLSHSGYDVDQAIAQNASSKISLIVGGHSHTFLYTGDNPPGPDVVKGPYPTIVESKLGHKVLVTQASAYCKYVGNITIYLNEKGEIVDYSGAPIFLDTSSPQDEGINADLRPWKEQVDSLGTKILGSSLVNLEKTNCYTSECTLGNFVTDAYVYAYTKSAPKGSWTEAAVAIFNAGGLRTNIEAGNVSYSDLVTAQPFGNTVDIGQIQGKYLKDLMESTTKQYAYGSAFGSINLLQVSGLQIKYDLTKPEGQRVTSMKVRCSECMVPKFEPLDPEKLYTIAVPSFLVGGGDGFTILTEHLVNKRVGPLDVDVFTDYLAHRSPVFEETGDRIKISKTRSKLINFIN